jgi:hypothetical protein
MVFGFSPDLENPYNTIYDHYLGKSVRVDVAGGIGGMGVVRSITPHLSGHVLVLKPYVLHSNGSTRVVDEEITINTSGSPVQICSLGKSLEEVVKEIGLSKRGKRKSK